MEIYNFKANSGVSPFNSLMLQSEVTELVGEENFNPSELQVCLKINGKTVRVEDFNKILSEWADRIESNIKSEVSYLKAKQSVIEEAEKLLESRLGSLEEMIDSVRRNKWKLED